jgi:hypothetical protein
MLLESAQLFFINGLKVTRISSRDMMKHTPGGGIDQSVVFFRGDTR